MKEFINGWYREKLGHDKYHWSCPYCSIKLTTHHDNVCHGCRLKEYGLADLFSDFLNFLGLTKKRFQNILRFVTRSKTIKCDCDARFQILNAIGRFLKINYILTTWKRGISPRRYAATLAAARAGLPPQKINACGKPPTPPPAAARLHNPA